ncbi:MAG: nucleotidyltransferase domain-containing protein [Myxococcales bacterium]|nr:nucleotidyltransferase domain-containing protein [Myxococcales bacterium]
MTAGQALPVETERRLAALAEAWPEVDLLMLFGSAASGRLGSESDVDLYVRLAHDTPRDQAHEERFLAAAVHACHREVDLVVETPAISVILRREVAAHGRPLFERTARSAHQFKVDAIRAYVDLEPQLRLIGAAIRARAVKEGAAATERLVGR